jgi:hypothetical protein
VIRILNDFNTREDDWVIVLNEARTPPEALVTGTRVILYEPDDVECEAIVRPGKTWPWVAEVVKGTVKYPGEDEK